MSIAAAGVEVAACTEAQPQPAWSLPKAHMLNRRLAAAGMEIIEGADQCLFVCLFVCPMLNSLSFVVNSMRFES